MNSLLIGGRRFRFGSTILSHETDTSLYDDTSSHEQEEEEKEEEEEEAEFFLDFLVEHKYQFSFKFIGSDSAFALTTLDCNSCNEILKPPVKVDPYITEIDDWICSVESTVNDKYYEIARHYHAVKDEDAFREIQMVVEKAKNIAEDARAMGRKKMDMEVRIQVCYEFEYFCDELEMLQLAILESAREEPNKFVPASKSAIDKLEKVVLEVDAISDGCCDCRICLEELKVGAEATRMPCSHMFHPSCIVEWLETSHVCPLCRFKLPV